VCSQCIYRINSMVQKAASLKEHSYKGSLLDSETPLSHLADLMPADMDSVNLGSEEWISNINNATNVLKMCLRELPCPLLISGLYQGLMDAASKHFMLPKVSNFSRAAEIENDRLRHVRLHERVNYLPDANYTTLMYLLGYRPSLLSLIYSINV